MANVQKSISRPRANTNHCPEIIFKEDGLGSVEDFSNFRWKIKDDLMLFSFLSNKDKKNFIYPFYEFTPHVYKKGELQYLKLIDEKSNSWCVLAKISN